MAKKKKPAVSPSRKNISRSQNPLPAEDSTTPHPPAVPAPVAAPAATNQRPVVVGVGASAGGLDAFKQLFIAMPSDTGMSFVLIQHLDPNHESLTAELLGKQTAMPVVQVEDAMRIEANHVYVIPPKHYLTVDGGALHLTDPIERRGLRMPIDCFFRSLAEEQQERSIGIILTGTGTDGTLGVREIKAAGGIIVVQDPQTAQHDGMIRSAQATGIVDRVLPIDKMPAMLSRYIKHWYLHGGDGAPQTAEPARDQLTAILSLLRARAKYDFSCYKKGTLCRRIQRRMGINHIDDMDAYLALLRHKPDEVALLYKDLLIGVTNFFREPEAWQELQKLVIEPLVRAHCTDDPIRIWTPGCATGEEPYSIAMLISETLAAAERTCEVQIFASDIDQRGLTFARTGIYPENIAVDVSPERLRQFFVKADHTFRINKQIREMVVFAEQNIVSDPPFSKLDLISCRNLMIYLDAEAQKKVLSLFHFALLSGGYLFLGNSETVSLQQNLFEPVSRKWRIYRPHGIVGPPKVELPLKTAVTRQAPHAAVELDERRPPRLTNLMQQFMLKRFAPACVLINRKGEILYLNGDLNDYLQLPSGELAADICALARPELRGQLRAGIREVLQHEHPVTTPPLRDKSRSAGAVFRIVIEPLAAPREAKDLLLVTFEPQPIQENAAPDSAKPPPPPVPETPGEFESTIRQLEDELRSTREELQSTIEELETSNEEFKASNEEVLSINEELQSANEELETSKEELQSLNEELQTVNSQLEQKVGELEESNNDLANFLANSDVATVFLDRDFHLRRFTPATTRLLRVIDADVGRPISDFARNFSDDELLADGRQVLRELAPSEREVQDHEGRWYLRRIVPYRTHDHRIDGIVIVFSEITRLKAAELSLKTFAADLEKRVAERTAELTAANAALSEGEERFRTLLEAAPDPAVVIDAEGNITRVNGRTEQVFGYARDELIGQSVEILITESLRGEHVRQRTKFFAAPSRQVTGLGLRLSARRKDGALFPIDAQLSPLSINRQTLAMETIRDISERKRLEQQLAEIADQERQTLGRELHDTLGQQLSGLAMLVATLKEQLGDSPAAKLASVVEQTKQQLRVLAKGLLPVAIDANGLQIALQDAAKEIAELYKIECRTEFAANAPLENNFVATQLFLIAREAISNAATHAKAHEIVVRVEDGDGLRVSVTDDGQGIPEDLRGLSGMGLRIMQHRAGLIGGQLKIEAAAGGGTIVDCHLNRERGDDGKN